MRSIHLVSVCMLILLLTSIVNGQVQQPATVSQTSGALLPPTGSSSGPMTPGDSIQFVSHSGSNPLGVCIDEVERKLYVCDLFSGTTHLYNIDDLAAGVVSTVNNPAGSVSTSGLDISGDYIYWAVQGASPNLWRSLKDGTDPQIAGNIDLPGGGIIGDICITEDQTIWAVDVTHDQYSEHSLTGVFLGGIIGHPAGNGSGNSIAYRSDCNLLIVPHNIPGATGVSAVSTMDEQGVIRNETDISAIGGFVNGIAHASLGSSGIPSLYLVDASLNAIYELESIPACPQPVPSIQHEYQVCAPAGVRPVSDSALLMEMVTLDTHGTVRDVDLYIEMEHSFAADLRVLLTSPQGTTVNLLNETQYNGSLWGLTFDDDGAGLTADGPGLLSDYDGEELNGNWLFTVTDLYPGDDGAVSNWCLRINQMTQRTYQGVSTPVILQGAQNLTINNAAIISDHIEVTANQPVLNPSATVDLAHDFLSDITVKLSSPAGTQVTLVGDGPASSGEIHTTFAANGIPYSATDLPTGQSMMAHGPGSMADFHGENSQGNWQLQVEDTVGTDDGVLHSWNLTMVEPLQMNVAGAPLELDFQVLENIAIADLELALTMEHPSLDQVHVTLTSPAGTVCILESFGGYAGTSIDLIYDRSGIAYDETLIGSGIRMQPEGSLDAFLGESMQGTWVITVQDTLLSSQGWVNAANLVIHGDDAPCVAPQVTATSSTVVADIPYPIAFSGIIEGSAPDAVSWDFGDGTGSPDLNTVHIYAQPGTYTARLTVENPCGTAFSQFNVIICEPPAADFGLLPGWTGVAPFCADFINQSSGTIDHLLWDFGNGDTVQNNGDVSYLYGTPGFYSVSLNAYGVCGTVSTMTRANEIRVLAMGDVNADGQEDTSDPISLVLYLFGMSADLPCQKTADVNGDQILNLGDVVHQLIFLFGGGAGAAPVTNCGSCDL